MKSLDILINMLDNARVEVCLIQKKNLLRLGMEIEVSIPEVLTMQKRKLIHLYTGI